MSSLKSLPRVVWVAASVATLFTVILATGAGSLARLFSLSQFSWSFEVVGMAFVWLTALGTVLAEDKGENVSLTLIDGKLPPLGRRLLSALRSVIVVVIGAAIAYSAWVMMGRSSGIPSPVMRIPMSAAHSAILALGAGLVIVQLRRLYLLSRNKP